MPAGDGSGPPRGRRGGRMGGNRPGTGPGGNCVCPGCGHKVSHPRGMPCYTMNCPQCGARMVRE